MFFLCPYVVLYVIKSCGSTSVDQYVRQYVRQIGNTLEVDHCSHSYVSNSYDGTPFTHTSVHTQTHYSLLITHSSGFLEVITFCFFGLSARDVIALGRQKVLS